MSVIFFSSNQIKHSPPVLRNVGQAGLELTAAWRDMHQMKEIMHQMKENIAKKVPVWNFQSHRLKKQQTDHPKATAHKLSWVKFSPKFLMHSIWMKPLIPRRVSLWMHLNFIHRFGVLRSDTTGRRARHGWRWYRHWNLRSNFILTTCITKREERRIQSDYANTTGLWNG